MTEPAAGRSEHERGQSVPAEREREGARTDFALRSGDTVANAHTTHYSPILVLWSYAQLHTTTITASIKL